MSADTIRSKRGSNQHPRIQHRAEHSVLATGGVEFLISETQRFFVRHGVPPTWLRTASSRIS